ncbi:MAG: helix-turn-helix transcriptional regulator [Clostridia bacterium]|nr:helix-turn-helix transcriptional regulator [Clostridia bacterium]
MTEYLYEAHVVADPSRPYICHLDSIGCMPHWHENIELLLFKTDGVILCNRTEYQVMAGDIVIFGYNALHAVPQQNGVSYYCLIVDSKFCTGNDLNIAAMRFDCVVRDVRARLFYEAAIREINNRDANLSAAGAKAAILTLMVYLCRNFARPDDHGQEHGDTVKRALGYINSHMSSPMTIDEIADYVKVSKYYFCREFRKETGFTVVRYINNLRCREAERLLRSSEMTVGEIARACGFENLSYFTRTFKAVTGHTPSEVRGG